MVFACSGRWDFFQAFATGPKPLAVELLSAAVRKLTCALQRRSDVGACGAAPSLGAMFRAVGSGIGAEEPLISGRETANNIRQTAGHPEP